MTELKLPSTALGLIFIAIVAFLVVSVIRADVKRSHLELETSEAELSVINAAHIIKECLGKEGIIEESFLESIIKEGKNICDVCGKSFKGLCSIDISTMVKDLEGSDEWKLGYLGSKRNRHEIFVNILHDTGKISIGRLYAEF